MITAKVNGLLAASDSVFYVNMINGHWQLDNAIYSFCTDPADNGMYVCPDDDCFRIHIGETKSYYSYMNDYSPEYNYTITDKEITIFDGTDFTAQYSIYNLSIVLVYLDEGCVVTETYHIY